MEKFKKIDVCNIIIKILLLTFAFFMLYRVGVKFYAFYTLASLGFAGALFSNNNAITLLFSYIVDPIMTIFLFILFFVTLKKDILKLFSDKSIKYIILFFIVIIFLISIIFEFISTPKVLTNNSNNINNTTSLNSNTDSQESRNNNITQVLEKDVQMGQNLIVNDYENINFEKVYFSNSLEPTKPSDYWNHYVIDDSNVNIYMIVQMSVKNLKTVDLKLEEIFKGKVMYDGKYEYTGSLIYEKPDGSDLEGWSWTTISPLSTARVYLLIKVPLEVQNSGKTIDFKFNVSNEKYKLVLR